MFPKHNRSLNMENDTNQCEERKKRIEKIKINLIRTNKYKKKREKERTRFS
jgi:hypothetical protein